MLRTGTHTHSIVIIIVVVVVVVDVVNGLCVTIAFIPNVDDTETERKIHMCDNERKSQNTRLNTQFNLE